MKKRIISITLVCAILLMGAGYAYWTDLITLTATVKFGAFDVDFVPGSEKEMGNSFNPTNYKETWERTLGIRTSGIVKGYENESYYDKVEDSISCNEDMVTISLDKLYPGHAEYYYVKAKNAGDVAAKLGQINATFTGYSNTYIRDMIGISLKAEQDGASRHWNILTGWVNYDFDEIGEEEFIELGLERGLKEEDFFVVDGKPYIRVSALDKIDVDESGKTNLYNILFLNEECEIEFYIGVAMDPDSEGKFTTGKSEARVTSNDDEWTENKNADLKLDFIWDQYNQE